MRFLLVPVLVASLGAQTPEAPAVDVAGRVVDSKTHRLLSGVAIQFRASGGDNLLTESDGNGRFRFEGVAPGRYSTTALRSGYLPGRAAFDIDADEEQEIVVELDPAAVVAGRVLDHLGRPMVSAKVTVYRWDAAPGSIEGYWQSLDSISGYELSFYRGVTNDFGEYRFWGLPKGEFVILAKPASPPGPAWVVRFDSSPVFYPNAATIDEAAHVRLDWGEVREGMDIRLGPPSPTVQTGRVLFAAEPCPRCTAHVYRKGQEEDVRIADTRTSETGEVRLEGLSPGEYIVGAMTRLDGRRRAVGSADLVVSTDEDRPFLVELSGPVNVRVNVVYEDPPDEIPKPKDKDSRFPRWNVARLQVPPHDREKVFTSCTSDAASLIEGGGERFFDLFATPGLCRLSASGPPGSYVAGMSLAGRPLQSPDFPVTPEGPAGELTVRIRFDQGVVSGRVEGAGPETQVFLFSSSNDQFVGYRSALVERDGSFRAEVPPGTWRVLALGRNPRAEWGTVFERLLRAGVEVTVQAGERVVLASDLEIVE